MRTGTRSTVVRPHGPGSTGRRPRPVAPALHAARRDGGDSRRHGRHRRSARRAAARGTTLPELVFVLALLGILISLAAPTLGRMLDRRAVQAARDELASAVAVTRAAALGGGAALHVDPARGRYWIVGAAGDTLRAPVALAGRHGVRLTTGRSGRRLVVRFDALGVGRVANATVRIERNGLVGGLSISAYGRVRPW